MKRLKRNREMIHKKLPSALIPIFGILSLLVIFALYSINGDSFLIGSASYTSSQQQTGKTTDEAVFQNYLDKLFQSEAAANTLNLHFILADPASAEISQYPITFGEISTENESLHLASLENMKKDLESYDTSSMSVSSQLTYDILKDSIDRNIEMAPYYYYQELLSSTNGIQSQYPILLAEYTFYSKKDVEDYLNLLSQYDTLLKQVCTFEKEKAKRGLFMNETSVENIIEQCRAFIPEDSKKSFWETTFSERLNEIKLTDQEKKSYKKQNQNILEEHVYPAYRKLIANLKALKKKGENTQGLCYLEDGKKYYELLVKSSTGSDRSIPELQKMVTAQREKNLNELSLLASILTKQTASYILERNKDTNNSNSDAAYELLSYQSPEAILEHLKKEILSSFPAPPETNYTVKNVSQKLQDFLSPAFYLTAPMDRYTENCIYINPGSNYDEIGLFTTLAHEGYPGHLYQTVYSYSKKLPALRYLLYHGGYTEGWATYVEMLSYSYAGLDPNTARALMLNQDATLSLYAQIDMGVHYDGWSLADTADFIGTYGVTDTSVISKIYQAIIENPANYLKYYIGYLEFLDLKEQAKNYYGNDFSELSFHTAVLDIGSAPFYIIDNYFVQYYKAAN